MMIVEALSWTLLAVVLAVPDFTDLVTRSADEGVGTTWARSVFTDSLARAGSSGRTALRFHP